MKVILVRHAETEWNMRGIIQGHSDSPLTHRGLRETSALLAALAASDHQIEYVYASPLGRAWQMGQRLAEHFRCSLTAEPALKEQAFGEFEGMSTDLFGQNHQNEAMHYLSGMQITAHQVERLSHMRLSGLWIFYFAWKQLRVIKQFALCLTDISVRAFLRGLTKGLSLISHGTRNPTRVTLCSI